MSLVLFIVLAGIPLYLFMRPVSPKKAIEAEPDRGADIPFLAGELKPHA